MGFGISSYINKFAKSAVIEWVDPQYEELLEASSNASLVAGYLTGLLVKEDITPDVKKLERHSFSSSISENVLESGAIVAEHVIQHPVRVSVQFEQTNNSLGSRYQSEISDFLGFSTVFDKLVELWEKKIECTVITQHKKYENMVIESMPIVHRSPYRGAYQVMAEFKQIKKRKIFAAYAAKDKGTSKSSMQTAEGGLQQTTDFTAPPGTDFGNLPTNPWSK